MLGFGGTFVLTKGSIEEFIKKTLGRSFAKAYLIRPKDFLIFWPRSVEWFLTECSVKEFVYGDRTFVAGSAAAAGSSTGVSVVIGGADGRDHDDRNDDEDDDNADSQKLFFLKKIEKFVSFYIKQILFHTLLNALDFNIPKNFIWKKIEKFVSFCIQ